MKTSISLSSPKEFFRSVRSNLRRRFSESRIHKSFASCMGNSEVEFVPQETVCTTEPRSFRTVRVPSESEIDWYVEEFQCKDGSKCVRLVVEQNDLHLAQQLDQFNLSNSITSVSSIGEDALLDRSCHSTRPICTPQHRSRQHVKVPKVCFRGPYPPDNDLVDNTEQIDFTAIRTRRSKARSRSYNRKYDRPVTLAAGLPKLKLDSSVHYVDLPSLTPNKDSSKPNQLPLSMPLISPYVDSKLFPAEEQPPTSSNRFEHQPLTVEIGHFSKQFRTHVQPCLSSSTHSENQNSTPSTGPPTGQNGSGAGVKAMVALFEQSRLSAGFGSPRSPLSVNWMKSVCVKDSPSSFSNRMAPIASSTFIADINRSSASCSADGDTFSQNETNMNEVRRMHVSVCNIIVESADSGTRFKVKEAEGAEEEADNSGSITQVSVVDSGAGGDEGAQVGTDDDLPSITCSLCRRHKACSASQHTLVQTRAGGGDVAARDESSAWCDDTSARWPTAAHSYADSVSPAVDSSADSALFRSFLTSDMLSRSRLSADGFETDLYETASEFSPV